MSDRIRLDDLTSDQLDALYAERDRYRVAWTSARERAAAYSEGILRHVADRDTWRGWFLTEQAHTLRLRAQLAKSEQGRRDATARIRAALDEQPTT
ncbi:hypothetical protein [Streptomyces sp. NPDC046751]|uniref:hypothetical protein n=1 Tax=Streptomyces sp. NPDC046751 TaxID=3160977 RepID=UPI0033FEE7E5